MKVSVVEFQRDIEGAIATCAEGSGRGLLVFPNPRTIASRQSIASLALRHRMPAVYPYRYFAADGGLITCGADQIEQWRGAALYLDRILKGEHPGSLPVQMPTKYEMAINLKAASAIGLTVPPALIARADEVIE